jgi:hypothetical protein
MCQVKSDIAAQDLKGHLTKAWEELAFEKVLCAFYNKPYSVGSMRELGDITWLASFYCALRMVSTSLYAALHNSPELIDKIPLNCFKALIHAQELRQPLLFREALIHVIRFRAIDHAGSRLKLDGHQDLSQIAEMVYNRLSTKVLQALHLVLASSQAEASLRNIVNNWMGYLGSDSPPAACASFYRKVYNDWPQYFLQHNGTTPKDKARDALKALLENKLALDTNSLQAGVGACSSSFLCAHIEDDELPWDSTAEDW